jgi:peptide deformylase
VSVRPIHLLGSPVLREQATYVGDVHDEIIELVKDLFDTMNAEDGIGLAANQIGVTRRVAVVQAEDDDQLVLIDPEIVEREGEERREEGCLSIPDMFGDVDRAQRIVVETTSLGNERIRVEAEALKARAIQHEIDHLDGILFIDHLSPLKRRMLVKKWKKLRKGETGHIKEVTARVPATPK